MRGFLHTLSYMRKEYLSELCCVMSYSVLQLSVMKRRTWTIEPDSDVKSLMSKEITRRVGKNGDKRGKRTEILHEAVRNYLAHLNGKREAKTNGK